MPPRNTVLLAAAAALISLTACSSPAVPTTDATDDAGTPHGYVEGAAELTEPQLTIATIDATGELSLLDLIEESTVAVDAIDEVTRISTDGRFVFASTPRGVSIVDTGVWTVDHEDHSHYYRAEPAVVGTLDGSGPSTVSGGGSVTAVTFADSGESVLLDTADLGSGRVTEIDRLSAELVVPFGAATLVAARDTVAVLAEPDTSIPCIDPQGTIATRVGVVIGCDGGAVLATVASDRVSLEAVPYPGDTNAADRAIELRGRPGRPTVAGVAGTSGFWLLDTRERSWALVPTDTPLLLVAAADDTDGNVVALDVDGRVLTLDGATGDTLAATEPLLGETVADPDMLVGVELTVDASRAYVNAPTEGAVFEIDYADGARVARTFDIPTSPLFLVETGRQS